MYVVFLDVFPKPIQMCEPHFPMAVRIPGDLLGWCAQGISKIKGGQMPRPKVQLDISKHPIT